MDQAMDEVMTDPQPAQAPPSVVGRQIQWAQERAPLCALMVASAAAGFGMFSESYMIFALGNVKGIWAIVDGECDGECHDNKAALGNAEVAMIMLGMITFGYAADLIGRRKGSISTASIMLFGGILTTAANGSDPASRYVWMCVAVGIFGYGVGGEYPLASASAAERAQAMKRKAKRGEKVKRGMLVVLVFTMQGWGSWFNCMVFYLGVNAAGASDCPDYDCDNATSPDTDACVYGNGTTGGGRTSAGNPMQCPEGPLNGLWRAQYAIGTIMVLGLTILRVLYLKESEVWAAKHRLDDKERRLSKMGLTSHSENTSAGFEMTSTAAAAVEAAETSVASGDPDSKWFQIRMMLVHYWPRLVGTALGWDIAFYGNKLFQTEFTESILDNPTISDVYAFNLANATIALCGYYAAAFTVDKPWLGRRGMQVMGFLVSAVCYLAAGFDYDWFAEHATAFKLVIVYWVSTFFGQWGPNSTTWLLPSELFPTDVRTFAHGFSAMCGKGGALVATLTFANSSTKSNLIASGFSCFVGLLVTLVFVPDVTELDLIENDDRWDKIMEGRVEVYNGEAVNPKHLSIWELFVCKNGRFYKGTGDVIGNSAKGIDLGSVIGNGSGKDSVAIDAPPCDNGEASI